MKQKYEKPTIKDFFAETEGERHDWSLWVKSPLAV